METKEKKPINYYMRILHRYIGFFILGFVLIFAFSGIVLVYRDSDFMKYEKTVKVNLPAGTIASEIGTSLRLRDFKVIETKGDVIYFQGGKFDTKTGEAEYTVKELIFPFAKLTSLHKSPSNNPVHWVTLVFGISLLFMAISSLWMFRPDSKLFRKGMITVLTGVITAVIILIFI
jgi:hypothetical protein